MDFLHAHGAPCFVGWPDNLLRAWLHFHTTHGTCLVVHDSGQIEGLAIAWQCARADLEKHWHVDDPTGDCLYIAQFVARTPSARRALIAAGMERWPAWRWLKLHGRRAHKGLCRMLPGALIRFYQLA